LEKKVSRAKEKKKEKQGGEFMEHKKGKGFSVGRKNII